MKTGKITAMIVEDNHEAACLLERYLGGFPEIELVASAANVDQATLAFLKYRPSLLFLDVELDDRTGFEFLDNIRGISGELSVIFITAFDHYAVEAIKHSAFDYLLKPVDPAELKISLERLKQKMDPGDLNGNLNELRDKLGGNQHLKLSQKHGFLVVNTGDILYCQADWNYSELFTHDGQRHLITMNLGQLEKKLPYGEFIRANRSLILNVKFLQSVDKEKGVCILKSGSREILLPMTHLKIRKLEKILEKRFQS